LQIGGGSLKAYGWFVNFLLLARLCLLFATIHLDGARGEAQPAVDASSSLPDTNVAAKLKQIDTSDDAAQADADRWIRENNELKATGGGIPESELERRIGERFEPIHKSYEDFLRRHPANASAHLAYGTFLNARQDERGAQAQWEKALELDPNNPEVYNNLAGRYSEGGPVNKAFEYFSKAIALSPTQAAYYHNFGDSLFVLRKNAATYYRITEQQVYGKVLMQYSNALRLDPQNFAFARDLAQTYYSLKPLPTDAALQAWTNALSIAHEAADREDTYVHLARVKMLAGRFAEARAQLAAVTNETSVKAKTGLLLSIGQREKDAATTK
jgi:tetratricopeptide (TPR) repeat protein